MKTKRIAVMFLILSLVLTACQSTTPTLSTYKADSAIATLASEEFQGRQAGTEGNSKAEEYIENFFQAAGLETFEGDSYLISYRQQFNNPDKMQASMSLTLDDGSVMECIYGSDFMMPNSQQGLDLNLPVTLDINDQDIQGKAFATADVAGIPKDKRSQIKLILRATEYFSKGVMIYPTPATIVQISERIHKLLQSNPKSIVNIHYSPAIEDVNVNNVIGKIPGNNSKEAIVISAHFDHVGWIGDTVYTGAIDNSSGVAALLSIVDKLGIYSKKNKMEKDIIFCAFNGEEYGLLGSGDFALSIKNKYQNIYNINIDCVGIKGNDKLVVISDEERCLPLKDSVSQWMESKGLEVDENGKGGLSDHMSFILEDMSAVTLCQDITKVLHTPEDTIDKLDYSYIEKLGNAVYEYVISNQSLDFALQ